MGSSRRNRQERIEEIVGSSVRRYSTAAAVPRPVEGAWDGDGQRARRDHRADYRRDHRCGRRLSLSQGSLTSTNVRRPCSSRRGSSNTTGVPLKQLMDLGGWKTPASVVRYRKPTTEQLRASLRTRRVRPSKQERNRQ